MSIVILAATQSEDASSPITVTDAASAHISLFDSNGTTITERVGATIVINTGGGTVDWVRDGRLAVLTNTHPNIHITEPGEYMVLKPQTTALIGVSRDGSGGG